MLQAYDRASVDRVRKIIDVREKLSGEGKDPSARNIQRRLGKAMRDGLTAEALGIILQSLDRVDVGEPFPASFEGRRDKVAAIATRLEDLETRLALNERKRNERRLRNLRNAHLASADARSGSGVPALVHGVQRPAINSSLCGSSAAQDAEAFLGPEFEAGDDDHEVAAPKIVPFRPRKA